MNLYIPVWHEVRDRNGYLIFYFIENRDGNRIAFIELGTDAVGNITFEWKLHPLYALLDCKNPNLIPRSMTEGIVYTLLRAKQEAQRSLEILGAKPVPSHMTSML